MSIDTEEDLIALQRIGRIVALALRAMADAARPGVTTAELDAIAADVLAHEGARATPRWQYGFPASACVSVNDEAVHGLPGSRALRPADVVKLDVTADRDGYVADAARTVVIGDAPVGQRLADAARAAFEQGLNHARAGNRVRDIGRAVEREARRRGFNVVREFCGHGIGRSVHEPPSVPSYDEPRATHRLTAGLVLTIEPILAAGRAQVQEKGDGWTLVTRDGGATAHHEDTILITDGRPVVLTAC